MNTHSYSTYRFAFIFVLAIISCLGIHSKNAYSQNIQEHDLKEHDLSTLEISLEVPEPDADHYFRPYVAVWLETPERDSITTLALWYQTEARNGGEGDGSKWLKDLRQWWRKTGRSAKSEIDGVTGATRKPGTYTLTWNGLDNLGNTIPAGEYLLNFEASREDGGREYLRQTIHIGQAASFSLNGESELGDIQINTQ